MFLTNDRATLFMLKASRVPSTREQHEMVFFGARR